MKTNAKQGLKGLRDIGTVRTVLQRQHKNERSHLVGRFARLDAERTRIEREIAMWSARKTSAEVLLLSVLTEIDAIRPMLIDEPLQKKTRSKGKSKALSNALDSNTDLHHSVSLNY
ncbi:MAG: hypothetical protein ACI9B8_002498 [Sulfitobacter sp.]|jgi:hypothetical protein